MRIFKNEKNSLVEVTPSTFRLEKDIQNLIELNTQEIFGLTFIKSEFSIGEYRIDTLCYDMETNSFVIIEYKKGSSYSVIDQGYSYLSIMLNNKSDFILEFNESTNGTLKRNDVDWTQSRIIFVSPSFNSYQKNSVNFKDIPFELFEIQKFENNTISLNQIISKSTESINKISNSSSSVVNKVNEEVRVYEETDYLKIIKKDLVEPYKKLKDKILSLDGVEIKFTRMYVNFWINGKVIVYVSRIKGGKVSVDIVSGSGGNKNPFIMDDPKSYFKEWVDSRNQKTYYHHLNNNDSIEYLLMMIEQKYNHILGK